MKLTSQEIQEVTQALGQNIDSSKLWTGLSTDSREAAAGALFLALVGENFDGHNFIAGALKQGCQGLIVQKDVAEQMTQEQQKNIQIFKVQDTLKALQQLAHYQSQKFNSCMKVAITGTSGKTTTKYFAHQLLEGQVPHYFSPKSFNNHIGVPLSLLDVQSTDQVALLEVGMNHHGEIKNLVSIIEPDLTLVTMVGRGHLEGLGTVEDVLKEKMSIYSKGHTHVINKDDLKISGFYTEYISSPAQRQIWVSSQDPQADIYLQALEDDTDPFGRFKVKGHILGLSGEAVIPISGVHHVTNVLMAVAIATQSGLGAETLWQRLSLLQSFWGRSEVLNSAEGLRFYFDAYNANPESMKAFFAQLQKLKTPPYIVLGEMLELGASTKELHYELGVQAAQTPHAHLWFMGPSGEEFLQGYRSQKNGKNPIISDSYKEDVALRYKSMLKTGDWIALKGSRGMHLESFLSLFEGVRLR